jgi:uncharacterized protein (TIGR02217 family)
MDDGDLAAVIDFFHRSRGRLHAFRFRDYADFKSCDIEAGVSATDQGIGVGDGVKTAFQLVKTYAAGGATAYVREITKPVAGSVVVALNGTPQGSGWSVDTTTGLVSFSSAPGAGVVVSAGYEFDVPVRFDADELPVRLDLITSGGVDVPLVEVRV